MTDEAIPEHVDLVYRLLNTAKRNIGEWAAVAVTHWLENNGAGCPDVPLMQEKIRDDAALWAGCAHQAEMEAYLSACLTSLEKSVLTEKAAKRLAATAYKSLTPNDRLAFLQWAEKQ